MQLDVKGCKDVYESFDKYVEEEKLEGENKYHAEQFGLQVLNFVPSSVTGFFCFGRLDQCFLTLSQFLAVSILFFCSCIRLEATLRDDFVCSALPGCQERSLIHRLPSRAPASAETL